MTYTAARRTRDSKSYVTVVIIYYVIMTSYGPNVSVMMTSALYMREEEPPTCYQARLRCNGDVTCRVLLETISKVCDDSSKSLFLAKSQFYF